METRCWTINYSITGFLHWNWINNAQNVKYSQNTPKPQFLADVSNKKRKKKYWKSLVWIEEKSLRFVIFKKIFIWSCFLYFFKRMSTLKFVFSRLQIFLSLFLIEIGEKWKDCGWNKTIIIWLNHISIIVFNTNQI